MRSDMDFALLMTRTGYDNAWKERSGMDRFMRGRTIVFALLMTILALEPSSGVYAKTKSHKDLITRYEGPQTCQQCHPAVMEDLLSSVHYKLKGQVSTVEGLSGQWGMVNRECGLPGSIMQINIGCVQCHIGNGTKITDTPTEQEKAGIDCLICHAKKYDMTKRDLAPAPSTPEGFRVPQDRSIEAAQSVGDRPATEACLRCHMNPAGGQWWKRGINFSPERDVHIAKGMTCVDCHKAVKHKFQNINDPGGWAKETVSTTLKCESCHKAAPHESDVINDHLAKIACNVCHIPTIGGVVKRDYVHVVKNEKMNLWVPKADPFDNTFRTKPVYRMYNGTGTKEISPIGSIYDPKSKITAFKPLTTVLPRDAKTKELLFMNLMVLSKTGSIDQALAKGIEQTHKPYSGAWEPRTITGFFSLSHDITKKYALTCIECHSKMDYLDLEVLGYSESRSNELTDSEIFSSCGCKPAPPIK